MDRTYDFVQSTSTKCSRHDNLLDKIILKAFPIFFVLISFWKCNEIHLLALPENSHETGDCGLLIFHGNTRLSDAIVGLNPSWSIVKRTSQQMYRVSSFSKAFWGGINPAKVGFKIPNNSNVFSIMSCRECMKWLFVLEEFLIRKMANIESAGFARSTNNGRCFPKCSCVGPPRREAGWRFGSFE